MTLVLVLIPVWTLLRNCRSNRHITALKWAARRVFAWAKLWVWVMDILPSISLALSCLGQSTFRTLSLVCATLIEWVIDILYRLLFRVSRSLCLSLVESPFRTYVTSKSNSQLKYTLQSQKIICLQQNTKHSDTKNNTEINIGKAKKGTTSVLMSLADKKKDG